jgi:miniconductance mechanosensitive channel
MFQQAIEGFRQLSLKAGLSQYHASLSAEIMAFALLFVLAVVSFYLTRWIIHRTIVAYITRTDNKFDDILLKNKVFSRASYFVPSFIISRSVSYALPSFPEWALFVQKFINVYVIFVWMILLSAMISTLYDFYSSLDSAKNKPVKGFKQVITLIVYIVGTLMIIATLLGQNIGNLVLGLGTLSAVLMLVFKDPILGFVGGLQLSANDMVRIGDWISMPKFSADGEVLEVTLTTVKVQNWDKTITTIPTYSLVSDSFVNWRGMSESGGRRIKRHINIDMESVRFCNEEMLKRFSRYQLVGNYISEKEDNIRKYNELNEIDTSELINGRRQTNLGVFRAYLKAYLLKHPLVHKELTILVRHLQPTERGLPMELYFFSSRQAWAEYEDLQSDVFDHVLAVIPFFELRVFQEPSGNNINDAAKALLTNTSAQTNSNALPAN